MEIIPLQIIYQIVNFSIIMGLLTYLLYKPILKVFEERSKRIEEGQKAAQDLIQEKAAIEQLKETTAKKLELEETKKMQAITDLVKENKQQLLAEAQKEVDAYIKSQQAKWQEEKQRRVKALRDDLVTSVIEVSQKVINKKLTVKDRQDLVDVQIDAVLARL